MQQLDGDLYDYKFMTFHGKPEILLIVSDRFNNKYMNWYDKDFNLLPFNRPYAKNSPKEILKGENYDKMIEFAGQLAGDLPFVRVDFYSVENKIYFGEMTFYPGSGFEQFKPREWDYKLGDMIDLDKLIKGENK